MPLTPLHQPSDGIVTQARAACGLGYQRRAGVCVRNTTVRRTRRAVRRCRRWNGGVCIRYYWPKSGGRSVRGMVAAGCSLRPSG